MQPNYIPQGPAFELDWSDRKAIQKLYGKAVLGARTLGTDRGHSVLQSRRGPHPLLTGRLAPNSLSGWTRPDCSHFGEQSTLPRVLSVSSFTSWEEVGVTVVF